MPTPTLADRLAAYSAASEPVAATMPARSPSGPETLADRLGTTNSLLGDAQRLAANLAAHWES